MVGLNFGPTIATVVSEDSIEDLRELLVSVIVYLLVGIDFGKKSIRSVS